MRSKLKVIGVRPNVVATWCTVAVTESETPSPLATMRVEPFWSAEISASCEFPTRPCADTIAGARDTHANVTPGTAALSASRASAVSVAPSPSEENVWLPGVIRIEPIRVRTACAELDTEVGVPLRTASAVMLVLPSRTPVTSPDAETRARVVSDEVHSKVKPLTATFPLSATAVSWRVPASTTVESPLMTTDVIVGGPPSPPPPPHPTTTPANPPTRIRRKRRMTAPRRRTLLGWTAPRWLSRWWLPSPLDKQAEPRPYDRDTLSFVMQRAECELRLHHAGGAVAQPISQVGSRAEQIAEQRHPRAIVRQLMTELEQRRQRRLGTERAIELGPDCEHIAAWHGHGPGRCL